MTERRMKRRIEFEIVTRNLKIRVYGEAKALKPTKNK